MKNKPFVHPYIPNSEPEIRAEMLREIGLSDVEELFAEIPANLRFKGRLDIPEPILSEYALKRHVEELLSKNRAGPEYLSFLGAGCWPHFVPAVVDEIVNRSEFLTAYCGGIYSDHGKYQARFEFFSLMGELLNMDVVSQVTYDWGHAAGLALRMASRLNGRSEVLLPDITGPERLEEIKNLLQPEDMPTHIAIKFFATNPQTGLLDLSDLQGKISARTAAVYFENPSYLGLIENQGQAVARLAHQSGALLVVGVDPISLGILTPPADYGADIVCGDLQSLGVHQNCGGGQAGFLAFRDDVNFMAECPLELYTILETERAGRYAFAEMIAERTSYGLRDQGKDWCATSSGLWVIAAAVYLSLLGPQGIREVGETIISQARYARRLLSEINGVKILFSGDAFKEFAVNFDETGKTAARINQALYDRKIFGGRILTGEFPQFGQSSLFCVTEVHTKEDIHRLVEAVREAVR